ncbi:MAG: bifunctional phosphoribosylaminoimidazolecarboxamide formyltransferase/IMP cyclohydrolase, partial [Thermoplasmata archaeon]|nr:bifunctional phosphoribosylaminoimidazolecarboxamide formyltransferase/IMP cyclohydrolase [Thermoplasmata archaeon]
GAFYVAPGNGKANIANAEQLHGKMLSYNNILDANHAIECVKEFEEPSAVIIKHATPSGIASASSIEKAWKDAFETDIYSPFGGVVAFNREVTPELANELSKIFLEIVIAPSYNSEALEILKRKKNLRILRVEGLDREKRTRGIEVRSVENGLLVQEKDVKEFDPSTWKVVTEKKPSKEDIKSMIFAVKSVRHVKSNAVVFVKGTKTVAIGGGQTARVDATWIAVHKGKDRIKGSIMASDAFFPFRDAVDLAAEHGVHAIVQPGGSIRDNEVIQAANEHGIIMVFTGQRCFLH